MSLYLEGSNCQNKMSNFQLTTGVIQVTVNLLKVNFVQNTCKEPGSMVVVFAENFGLLLSVSL